MRRIVIHNFGCDGLVEYIERHGRHFGKALFEFAVSLMRGRDGRPLEIWDGERCSAFLKEQGVIPSRGNDHDAAYVVNMARADYYGSSLDDPRHLALFVRDYLDDIDGSPSRAFDEFCAKVKALKTDVPWDKLV